MAQEIPDDEVQSTYQVGTVEHTESIDMVLDYMQAEEANDSICLANFGGPEIQADHEFLSNNGDNLERTLEAYVDTDAQISKSSNSDMSLDDEFESMTGIDST